MASQSQTIIDLGLLSSARGHDFLATKAAIGADNDLRFGAAFTHRGNDFLERLDRTPSRVPVAGAKLGPERDRADKGKEGQITVAAIEAVKETSFLMTVQRIVTGIQIDDDLLAMLGQTAHPHPQKGVLDRLMVGADFMTTCIFIVTEFQPVESRSAGQRLTLILRSTLSSQRILFPDRYGKERIEPQKIMIIEILIACGQSQQTLGHQFADGVFDQKRVTEIAKAPGQGPRETQALINLAQQEHAAIAAEVSRGEVGNHLTRTQAIKEQGLEVGGKRLGRSG